MISFNVKSLYTSIPNAGGIKAVKVSFDTSKIVATKIVKTFWLFLQIKDCVMGTICEPFHTSIFMDHFEKKYIYPFLPGPSFICLWFIDDIFFIWSRTKEKLTNCWNNLNKKHNWIKFEYTISQTSITFRDKEVFIQNNKLVTQMYRKSTNCQNFLYID